MLKSYRKTNRVGNKYLGQAWASPTYVLLPSYGHMIDNMIVQPQKRDNVVIVEI